MDELWKDVVSAVRRLVRAPVFTIFSVASLAIGVGVTTAVSSMIYTVVRPPDIVDVDRVANLYQGDPHQGAGKPMWLSLPDFEDLRAAQTSFSHLTAFARFREVLVAHGSGTPILGEVVGGDYFSLVGFPPLLGRLIQPSDDRPGASPVIVLGESFWRRRFGADASVVGKTVRLNGHAFEVIGVAIDRFRGLDLPKVAPTPGWVPVSTASLLHRDGNLDDRNYRWLYVRARLKDGVPMNGAASEISAIGQRLDSTYPLGGDAGTKRTWTLLATSSVKVHESVDPLIVPLAGAIAVAILMVLLVVCSNLANLALARGAARRHEIAVCLALGASRWRLVRAQLMESSIVGALGLMFAIAVARVLLIRVFGGPVEVTPDVIVQFAPVLDRTVLIAAVASACVALVICGLGPALATTRSSVQGVLVGDSQVSTSRWRGRRLLIAAQVSVSVVLLAAAAICIQQITATAMRDTGLALDKLAMISVDFTRQNRDELRARRTLDEIVRKVRQENDIVSASVSSGLPLGIPGPAGYATTPERSTRTWDPRYGRTVRILTSSPDFLHTTGIALKYGRAFDGRDTERSRPVAIVSETIAKELAARGYVQSAADALGHDIVVVRQQWAGEPEPVPETRTIVGVTADTDVGAIGRRREGLVIVPLAQHFDPRMTVVVRATSDPDRALETLRRTLAAVDSELAPKEAMTGPTVGGFGEVVLRAIATGVSGLGMLALGLAMGGLYGVLSEVVWRRTREMGIRMALGAGARDVVRIIVWDGARPVLYGLVVGLAFAAIVRMGLRPMFLRVMPAIDPLMFAAVPALFLIAALVACYFPARRAARVEPVVALRHQ